MQYTQLLQISTHLYRSDTHTMYTRVQYTSTLLSTLSQEIYILSIGKTIAKTQLGELTSTHHIFLLLEAGCTVSHCGGGDGNDTYTRYRLDQIQFVSCISDQRTDRDIEVYIRGVEKFQLRDIIPDYRTFADVLEQKDGRLCTPGLRDLTSAVFVTCFKPRSGALDQTKPQQKRRYGFSSSSSVRENSEIRQKSVNYRNIGLLFSGTDVENPDEKPYFSWSVTSSAKFTCIINNVQPARISALHGYVEALTRPQIPGLPYIFHSDILERQLFSPHYHDTTENF